MTNGHGGKREGAGRPPGSKSVLAEGDVKAIKSLRRRIPEDVGEVDAQIAQDAFDVMVEVMTGKIHEKNGGRLRLSAATAVREDVCIPKKQSVEHSGGVVFKGVIDPYAKPDEDDEMDPLAEADAGDDT